MTVLRTKLFIPQIRQQVRRPRLVANLNAGVERRLTLLSAPPGFGKTSALAEWAEQTRLKVAWLSLDDDDNDPALFLHYIVSALQTVLPGVGEAALAIAGSPEPGPMAGAIASLINDVVAEGEPVALVLDDYHVIKARPIHDAVTYLVEHMPACLHLVIATRADPPLPLASLRARGQMAELRVADLRFAGDEAATFLNQMSGLGLTAADVAALEARTEGWIAGLQLAALSLKGREDVSAFVAAFTGSHHFVLDYLTEEVVRRQPEEIQAFLLRTAILERMCGELCDALRDEGEADAAGTSAQSLLDYLDRNNLFVVPLDDERHWFRYHHLFADLLRTQAGRLAAERLPELHLRASLWYERKGAVAEAVRHALNAGDWPRATALIERYGPEVLNRGEIMTVVSWLAVLPEDVVRARPRLGVCRGWALVLTGRLGEVEDCLCAAEVALAQPEMAAEWPGVAGHIQAIRAYAAAHLGDAARSASLAREALGRLPEAELPARAVVSYTLGTASLLVGQVPEACQAMAEAARLGAVSGNVHIAAGAHTSLGTQLSVLGRLHEAHASLQTGLKLTSDRAGNPFPLAATAYFGLSEIHYEWRDLEAAAADARTAITLGRQHGNAETLIRAYLSLARTLRAQGNLHAAHDALRQAEDMLAGFKPSPWALGRVEACRSWLWLAPVGGDLPAAAQWAEKHDAVLAPDAELPYLLEREHLALARVLAGVGRIEDALALLARLRQAAEAGGRVGRHIEMLAVEAAARQARGEHDLAQSMLVRALALAEPEGFVSAFLDAGAPLADLLARVARGYPSAESAYARRLLNAWGIKPGGDRSNVAAPPPVGLIVASSDGAALLEPLSERELEVLRWMEAGLTNGEIAERLVIAVSTVKRHINHIFGKLGASSRVQALVKARERRLL